MQNPPSRARPAPAPLAWPARDHEIVNEIVVAIRLGAGYIKRVGGNHATAPQRKVTVMEPITYGQHVIDILSLPPKSVEALIKRGLTHYLGNEQAAKVSGWIADQIPDSDTMSKEQRKAAIKAFRESNINDVMAKTNAVVAAAVAALTEGTIGVRAVAGPKADPVEKVMRELAIAHIAANLAKHGLKMPTGNKTVTIGEHQLTRDELVARQFARDEAGYRTKAEAEIRRRAKAVEKAEGLDAL